MQLSLAQMANLASRCLDIFEQLRSFNPYSNVFAGPLTEVSNLYVTDLLKWSLLTSIWSHVQASAQV